MATPKLPEEFIITDQFTRTEQRNMPDGAMVITDQFTQEPPEETSIGGEFVKGAKSGWLNANQAVGQILEYGGKLTGIQPLEDVGKTTNEYWGEKVKAEAPAVSDIQEIDSWEKFGKWAAWNIGQSGSQIATTLPFMFMTGGSGAAAEIAATTAAKAAAAKAAGTVGWEALEQTAVTAAARATTLAAREKLAEKSGFQVLADVLKGNPEAGTQFGKFVGNWARLKPTDIPVGILEGGQVLGGQLEALKKGEIDELHPIRGLAAAFVATKLEELGDVMAVDRMVHGVGGQSGNLIARIAKGFVGTGSGEALEEFFQQYAEQFGINPKDIGSKEQFMQAVNGAAAGFVGGGAIGMATGLPKKAASETPAETPGQPQPVTPDAPNFDPEAHKVGVETFRDNVMAGKLTKADAFAAKREMEKHIPGAADEINKIIIEAEGNKLFAEPAQTIDSPVQNVDSVSSLPAADTNTAPAQIVQPEANVQDNLPVETPVADISLSKDVPQFKKDATEAGIVKGQQIQGTTYDRTPLNPIIVWERLNGKLEVITGRHRLEYAKRIGEETVPTQRFREADGFTAKDALRFDAEQNIKDNMGSEYDYANYFRQSGISEADATGRGLVRLNKGRDAFRLGQDSTDATFDAYRRGDITFRQAVAIAESAPKDVPSQMVAESYIRKNPKADPEVVKSFMKLLRKDIELNPSKYDQMDMFKTEGMLKGDAAIAEADKMAKEAQSVISDLKKESSALSLGKNQKH